MKRRTAMPPAEFDAASRHLMRCHLYLSGTSWWRSEEHNAAVGGHPSSKHILGMARDYVAPTRHGLDQAAITARKLGMWWRISRGQNGGQVLHTQGLPPGPVARHWRERYGKG